MSDNACMLGCILIVVAFAIFFGGTPDIHDALIAKLMGSCKP